MAEIVLLLAGVLADFSEDLVAHIIDVFSVFKQGKSIISAAMVRHHAFLLDDSGHHVFSSSFSVGLLLLYLLLFKFLSGNNFSSLLKILISPFKY